VCGRGVDEVWLQPTAATTSAANAAALTIVIRIVSYSYCPLVVLVVAQTPILPLPSIDFGISAMIASTLKPFADMMSCAGVVAQLVP
jgi:hypothetical protein